MIVIERFSTSPYDRFNCDLPFSTLPGDARCGRSRQNPSEKPSPTTKSNEQPDTSTTSPTPTIIRPLVDIHEDDDSATLALDLPGFQLDNLTIDLDYNDRNRAYGRGGVLNVGGTRTNRLGRRFEFHRRFALNKVTTAGLDCITANFSDGVLEIVVPKVEPQKKTRTIEISTPRKTTTTRVNHEVKERLDDVKEASDRVNNINTSTSKTQEEAQEHVDYVAKASASSVEETTESSIPVETVLANNEAEGADVNNSESDNKTGHDVLIAEVEWTRSFTDEDRVGSLVSEEEEKTFNRQSQGDLKDDWENVTDSN